MSSTPAKKPVAAPAAATVGITAALALTALGAVAIRDTLVATGLSTGTPWIEWLLGKAEVLKPVDWMIPAGIAAVLIGLWILIAALKPRRTTHLAVGDHGVWIRGRDAARLAGDTAATIDSVITASSKAKGRKLRITATSTAGGDANRIHDDLTTAITQRLHTVTPAPRLRARVTVEEN
ncbi:DUF6286 domain-containing protein [Kribbella sp. CA-293567]|uniref:DUF6286 domain-containing protein n=1 Tax=Kribbella sp. CA-293567 TaxID=3002436 RepID=UPI0022DD6B41|nr:DUF6286 domain-containing protein [Kribbella sp. CA-293567]WBQ03882.1 DUF6286 domain-containing protein [Kribbella sp. CA-293567]